MNHQLVTTTTQNSSLIAPHQKNNSVINITNKKNKINDVRKMPLSTQTVRVYLRFTLTTEIKTNKKANLISKNVHRVLRSIWRHDSELRNEKLVKNFKLLSKLQKYYPSYPLYLCAMTHQHLSGAGRRLQCLCKHKAQRLCLIPLLPTTLD